MAPLATRQRTFRIRQDPTRAKSDWVYSEPEVIALYRVSRNTIPNWIMAGLGWVPYRGRRLFLGAELNRFHRERRLRAKRRPERDELYCIACKAQQSMAGREVVLVSRRPPGSGWLHWACPECNRVTALAVSSLQIERQSNHGVRIASAKAPTE